MIGRVPSLLMLLLALPVSTNALEPFDIRYPVGVKGIPPGASSDSLFGFITSNVTLTKAAPGPVWHVIGDLYVQPGVTLTIEAGVTILFQANSDLLNSGDHFSKSELLVRGTLLANGADSDSIRFRSTTGGPETWGQIKLEPSATASCNYNSLSGAVIGIAVNNASLFGSQNVCWNTTTGIQTYGGGLIYLQGWRIKRAAVGIHVSSTNIRATDCEFLQCSNTGIFVDNAQLVRVDHCLFASGSGGVRHASAHLADIEVNYCTFDGNIYGVSAAASFQSVTARLRNSLITRSFQSPIIGNTGVTWNVDYSDIWNNGLAAQGAFLDTGNVAINPLYVNPAVFDYRLPSFSPCRTLGESGSQMGYYGPGGAVSGVGGGSTAPSILALLPNVPNPFKSHTLLRFTLSRRTDVRISVYDVEGRIVTSLERSLDRGLQEISWTAVRDDGHPVADGVYFYRVEGPNEVQRGKLVIAP